MKLYDLFEECLRIPYSQSGGSANYATRRAGDTLYIFFESSDGDADWKVNMDFPAKAYKRMGRTVWLAHRGFLTAWKQTEPLLADAIADKTVGRIIITGYSHGAAIAVLCHEYVWFNRPDLRPFLEGYGFGCPRVLWGMRSAAVRQRWAGFSVIRNIDDAITHLPPAALGYFHVGNMLEIGKKGKYSPIDAHRSENILSELAAYEGIYAPV
ncbi:MAG: lipase family protein [Clostridia bacterium]|nr:lipase family protein [Clostridia bacterium]